MTLLLLLDELPPLEPAAAGAAPWWRWDLGVSFSAMGTHFGTTEPDEVFELDFADDYGRVSVIHFAGEDPLFVRVDGESPSTSGEAGSFVVLPGTRRVLDRSSLDGATEIRAISAGVVSFEVEV